MPGWALYTDLRSLACFRVGCGFRYKVQQAGLQPRASRNRSARPSLTMFSREGVGESRLEDWFRYTVGHRNSKVITHLLDAGGHFLYTLYTFSITDVYFLNQTVIKLSSLMLEEVSLCKYGLIFFSLTFISFDSITNKKNLF